VTDRRFYNLMEMPFIDVQRRIKEEGNDLVLVPLGSTEKHGAHIPLGCDSYITIRVTEIAAERADVLHTPLLPFGYSPHHMGRVDEGCGTVTLSAETYRRVLHDITNSLIFPGINKVIRSPLTRSSGGCGIRLVRLSLTTKPRLSARLGC